MRETLKEALSAMDLSLPEERIETLCAFARRVIEQEWTQHLGVRRMRQLREALELLREITDPYL